jgi:hypothetical protein
MYRIRVENLMEWAAVFNVKNQSGIMQTMLNSQTWTHARKKNTVTETQMILA